MKKRIAQLCVLAGLFVATLLLFGMSALAADPLTHEIEITPKALTGPGSVRVSINVINMGDDGSPVSVTLFDPAGNLCSGFGSGGTANLASGQSAAFSGNWSVNDDQLSKGRITYTARYTVTDESGNKVPASRPISATITHNQAKAQLNIERVLDPGMKVQKDQTVTVRYTIKNVGTVDVTEITIADPGIIANPVVKDSLPVGQTAELSYSYVADTTSKTTHAEITYKFESGGQTQTSKVLKADPPLTIEVTVPELLVQLTSETQIVNPGDKVDLTYQLTNNGSLNYEKLKITDKILNDIDSGISLAAGKTHQGTKSITVNTSGTYQFTVVGVDSSGKDVFYLSNELTIQTTDMVDSTLVDSALPTELEVVIDADRDVVYSMPAEVVFHVKVTNIGENPASNVTIAAAKKTVKTIDKIDPGQTVDIFKALNISMGGKYQFTASTKDSTGADSSSESNIFSIVYQAPAPTPTPTQMPTPEPTEPPPIIENLGTEEPLTPFSPDGGRSSSGLGSILLYVLGGLLAVIVVAVGALFIVDQRRTKARQYTAPSGGAAGRQQPIKVIDTIQRTPHRDYTRPAKRTSNAGGRDNIPEPADDMPPPQTPTKPSYLRPSEPRGYENLIEPLPVSTAPVTPKPQTRSQEDKPISLFTQDGDGDDADAFDVARIYKRPDAEPDMGDDAVTGDDPPETPGEPSTYSRPSPSVAELFDSGMSEADAPRKPFDETREAAYPGGYSKRTQGSYRDSDPGDVDPLDDTTPAPTARSRRGTEEEQSSLLSGSTGQYRLSRRTTPARGDERPIARSVEDPEAFARKQRVARPTRDTAPYYDEEEDELPPKRRR